MTAAPAARSTAVPHAVLGATGQQGGAVVDALLDAGAAVRAVVRDPSSGRARALAGRGVDVVAGDLDDLDSLVAAFDGAAGAFLMTTFAGPDGTDGEVRRGRTAADAVARAGVPAVVYSSVGAAERHTEIPHFESKRRVEEHLSQLVPGARFVRPTFFMENLAGQLADPGGDGPFVLRLPLPAAVPLQVVAVRDIGRVAAAVLLDPDTLGGEAVEIAGDELPPAQLAERIGEHLSRPARYEELPAESVGDADQAAMFRWLGVIPAYAADRATTRRLAHDVLDFRSWLTARDASG